MILINNSLASVIHECHTKAWVMAVQQKGSPSEPKGAREVGQVIHAALAAHLLGREWRPVLQTEWARVMGDELPQEERLQPWNVEQVMAHWINQMTWQFEVVAAEVTLKARLGDLHGEEVWWYGTLDLIVRWNEQLWVVDHKSTGRHLDEEWRWQWPLSSQPQGYVWGARANNLAVMGAFVLGLELARLPPWDGNLDKKCSAHKVKYEECQAAHVRSALVGPLTWTEAQLAQWHRSLMKRAAQFQQLQRVEDPQVLDMGGMYSYPGCGRCPFQMWCMAGRPQAALEQAMVERPWRWPEQVSTLKA